MLKQNGWYTYFLAYFPHFEKKYAHEMTMLSVCTPYQLLSA
jgi:hypothetical protein